MGCNRGLELAGVVIAMTMLAIIVAALRFYVRIAIVKNFARDDWVMMLAITLTIIMSACMVTQAYWGVGSHIEHLTAHHIERILFWFYISVIFYNTALGLVKILILLQYLRIFSVSAVRVGCVFGLLWMSAFTLETTMISIFDCSPINYFWDKTVKGGACVDFKTMWFCHAAINIFSDLYLICVPMPAIVKLMLPLRQKLAVIGAFSLGFFAFVASVLRLSSLYRVSESKDITYDNVDAAIWSCVELCLGVICASLPTLKAILGSFFPSMFGSFTSQGSDVFRHSWNSSRRFSIPTRPMPTRSLNTFRQYHYDSAQSVTTLGSRDDFHLRHQEPPPRYTLNAESFRRSIELERGRSGESHDDSRQDSTRPSADPSDMRDDPQDPRRDSTLPFADLSDTRLWVEMFP